MVASITAPRDASVYRSPMLNVTGKAANQPQQGEQPQPLPSGPQQPGRDHEQDCGQQEPALAHPEDREADGRHLADSDPDGDHRRSEQHRRRRRARIGA
jgi:hypothetical protein